MLQLKIMYVFSVLSFYPLHKATTVQSLSSSYQFRYLGLNLFEQFIIKFGEIKCLGF